MAQQIVLIDDLDGGPADQTVYYSFNGQAFEIDLSEKNLASLTKALEKYITHSRLADGAPAKRRGRPAGSTNKPKPERDFDPRVVREWLASQNIEVSPRGRIATELVDKWRAANA